MPAKKRGLGKALNHLLAMTIDETEDDIVLEEANEKITPSNFINLPVKKIVAGIYQPRQEIDQTELESLAESIRSQGIIQPILVRAINKDQYEIIAGERRFRAGIIAGLESVPVIIKEVSNKEALAMALIENIQRQDLSPLDEAQAIERLAKEFNLTHQEAANLLGKSRTAITNLLRLLNLNADVKVLLERGEIELGHAKVLLAVKGSLQSQLARMVVAKNLSVREIENIVNNQEKKEEKSLSKKPMDPDIKRLQVSLSDKLGAQVKIMHNIKGRGKLIIQYNNIDELDGILEHIK
ncbi:MAG: parB-like partition protein [Francisellaceae bacterium]|nr:parB-like partition protein [Francisellaceae bacterium]